MADKTSIAQTIAVTEKKMGMTLDDIIKMSKTNVTKPKKQQRISNRDRRFESNVQDKSAKVQRFMNTRSSMRQGALAQRRTNFQGNRFPLTTEAARKAATAPIRNKAFNRSWQTSVTKPRVDAKPTQKNAAKGGGFIVKRPLQKAVVSRQNPQTLDSLFADMKEQRMSRVIPSFQFQSQSQSMKNGFRRNGGSGQQRRGVPWARNRSRN